MESSQPTWRETVRVLAALSDENRFRIVDLLAARGCELSCGAISKALDLSPSLLSHHLAILAEAGIIGRRKNGTWTMNALQRPVLARQVETLETLIGANGNGAGHAPDAGDDVAVAAGADPAAIEAGESRGLGTGPLDSPPAR